MNMYNIKYRPPHNPESDGGGRLLSWGALSTTTSLTFVTIQSLALTTLATTSSVRLFVSAGATREALALTLVLWLPLALGRT